jgi:hypothetical protein
MADAIAWFAKIDAVLFGKRLEKPMIVAVLKTSL